MECHNRISSYALVILVLPVDAKYPESLGSFAMLAYTIGKEELAYLNVNVPPFAK